MTSPNELLYSEEHEWVCRDGMRARIGITDFAVSELGDIVYVELPAVGGSMKRNEVFGSVESVKTVSELYAPLSGTVVAVNPDLADSPENISESPYEAWMVELELSDAAEADGLLSNDAYQAHISA